MCHIQQTKDNTLLHKACGLNDVDCIKLLLQNGLSVNHQNKRGEAPLHKAATVGSLDAVKELVKHNAALDIFTAYEVRHRRRGAF